MIDRTLVMLCVAAGLTLGFGILLAFYMLMPRKAHDVVKRLLDVTRAEAAVSGEEERDRPLRGLFRYLAAWIKAHLGLRVDPGMHQRFLQAGLDGQMAADLYQSARILGPLALFVLGSMIPRGRLFWMATLPAIAYLAPDLVLGYLIRRRRDRIRRSVPDFVDLLVICVDAGLGLDQAMLRVGAELSASHPETNAEILQINREQRAGRPRIDAWGAMAARVKLADMDALVNMLMQTERFGMPITKALGTFAEGVRLKRSQAAEELAAKSTIKIIFPLVFFIFPAIFIVLLGPAALNIAHALAANK